MQFEAFVNRVDLDGTALPGSLSTSTLPKANRSAIFKQAIANRVDPDETAPQKSCPIRVYSVCLEITVGFSFISTRIS